MLLLKECVEHRDIERGTLAAKWTKKIEKGEKIGWKTSFCHKTGSNFIFFIKHMLFNFPEVWQYKIRYFGNTKSNSEAIRLKTREEKGLDRKSVISSLAPANVKNLLFEDNLKSFETLSVHGASLVSLKTSLDVMIDCFMEKEYIEVLGAKESSGCFSLKKSKKH